MSGRRSANRIRGPQSALTDFLAANNISAAQIRDEYERRRRANDGENTVSDDISVPSRNPSNDGDVVTRSQDHGTNSDAILTTQSAHTTRSSTIRTAGHDAKLRKVAKTKKSEKKNTKRTGKGDHESDDENDVGQDMYKKARPAPGQFEHCETCSKRFTVTPYSKEGAKGGLLCTACGKLVAKASVSDRTTQKKSAGRKRRKIESERLDGIVGGGAKSLQELCVQRLAQHHNDIEALGDLPASILERLAQIFAKRRVMRPKTLPLFLRPDLEAVVIHDAAYLEVDDYKQICAIVPHMKKLVLSNACQMKDEVIEYMVERCRCLQHVSLYAANLVTDSMWQYFFKSLGQGLRVLKLKWLDAALGDEAVAALSSHCPNIDRLKLKFCRRLGNAAVEAISRLPNLRHLSLLLDHGVVNEALHELIQCRGANLETLSLEKFIDADDSILEGIRQSCNRLSKLRFSGNDTASDAGYAALFTNWKNPSLHFADFSSTRDIDNNNPGGPENPIGLASIGFQALMSHSGPTLRHLDIASCRHIDLRAFMDVFNGSQHYPELEYINISFCNRVDTSVIAGIFKSCPKLRKLVAFGCFDVQNVVVPRRIALIGVPKAQDTIEKYGIGVDVEEAIDRMVEVIA